MDLIIYQERCNGCGACVEACPPGAIFMHNGKAFIDQSKCSGCQSCIGTCPTGAVQLIKTEHPIVSVKPASIEVVHPEPVTAIRQKETTWVSMLCLEWQIFWQHIWTAKVPGLSRFKRQTQFPCMATTPTDAAGSAAVG